MAAAGKGAGNKSRLGLLSAKTDFLLRTADSAPSTASSSLESKANKLLRMSTDRASSPPQLMQRQLEPLEDEDEELSVMDSVSLSERNLGTLLARRPLCHHSCCLCHLLICW